MTFTDPARRPSSYPHAAMAMTPVQFHHAAAMPAEPFYHHAAAMPAAPLLYGYTAVPAAPLYHAAFVPPPPVPLGVPVHKVWARNFTAEMDALDAFATRARYVAVSVQYPGVLYEDPGSSVTAEEQYAVLKANVDALKPLQLGLAVLRDDGRCAAWEFNLTGFDLESDLHSARSVEYLEARGMKLNALRADGVPVNILSMRLHHCGLLHRPELSWVTYDGAYHVAYLLKVLNADRALPGDIAGFLALAGRFLEGDVYDVARMAHHDYPSLPKGLESIAGALGLPAPPVGQRLAGGLAVLALQSFICLGPSFYPGFAPVI